MSSSSITGRITAKTAAIVALGVVALGLPTAAWATPITLTFQEGVDGYAGTVDTYIQKNAAAKGDLDEVWIDTDATNQSEPAQGLVQFANIIGSSVGQIPVGATILSATLTVTTDAENQYAVSGGSADGYRVDVAWDEAATWANSFDGDGLTIGTDTLATKEFTASSLGTLGAAHQFDVTASVQAWVDGAANHGWAIMPDSNDGWIFDSSETSVVGDRPMLSVTFVPEPSSWLLGLLAVVGVMCHFCRR